MSAIRLDGREIAAQMREEMGREVAHLAQEHMLRPGLAVVLVGENPASQSYVRSKTQACQELGVHSVQLDFPASLSTEALLGTIAELNADESIHGILVQLPMPNQGSGPARRTPFCKYCSAVA